MRIKENRGDVNVEKNADFYGNKNGGNKVIIWRWKVEGFYFFNVNFKSAIPLNFKNFGRSFMINQEM